MTVDDFISNFLWLSGPGNGLTIHVKIPGDEELMAIRMMSPAEPSKKPSVLFIAALQKVS